MWLTKLKAAAPYVIVLGVAAFLFSVATHFDFTPERGRIGPDFWPKLILALTIAASAYEIVKLAIWGQREVEGVLESIVEEVEGALEPAAGAPPASHLHLLALGIALTVAYVALIETLGFFIDTVAYLALFMVLGRYRRAGVVLATSALGTLLFVFIFMKIVYVSLPIGRAPFAAVSLLVMNVLGIR